MKAAYRCLLLLLVPLLAARAQTPAEPAREKAAPLEFSLWDLLPKPFSKNPKLEMTVFTEMTEYGRTIAPPTPQAPVYFEGQNSGLQTLGDVMAGDTPIPQERLNDILFKALAADGYLPAGPGHEPALVLVYFWGTHNRLDRDMAGQFPELAEKYVLERAGLVGGRKYRQELARGFEFGFSLGDRTQKKLFLFYQAADDIYFTVVSAYAYADLARQQRRLLWRTTMTVNARGVSMSESLPPLIMTAKDYFGRATDEPVALRRQVRRGTVTFGPLEVIEADVALPKKPADKDK